ncbi:hypothetical protein BDZ94DRAFT_1254074 [Collybia nuda]|uniref:Epidermal growth factor receptor-like transmembrane-juxtamembrane segment domain-containing protein n=1 Tax=Collybia nuda TaxID=64659 RepID=A0A9P5YAT0_9AGAR|nr:hypothetical protein BDZ94DRAFT_1254074 [Collybia nuda]
MASNGVRVAVIEVGGEPSSSGGKYQFQPPTTNALVGTIVTFDFSRYPGNHSVTQSTFDSPCQPLAGGFDSGVIFTSTTGRKEWNLTVMDTAPIWFYCKELSPAPHCNLGMVGVINAPAYSEPFTAFLAAARTASVVMPTSITTATESVSSVPASAPSTPLSTASKPRTAAIAGGVVGGVGGFIIFIVATFFWYRRRAMRRKEDEGLTKVTAFPAESDAKDEVERLRMQVQQLERERRMQGTVVDNLPPENIQVPVAEVLVHTDSGLRLGTGRAIEELPPRYAPE